MDGFGVAFNPGGTEAVQAPLVYDLHEAMPQVTVSQKLPRLEWVYGVALKDPIGAIDNTNIVHAHTGGVGSEGGTYHRTKLRPGASGSRSINGGKGFSFVIRAEGALHDVLPVSYTHLTLPTNREV